MGSQQSKYIYICNNNFDSIEVEIEVDKIKIDGSWKFNPLAI